MTPDELRARILDTVRPLDPLPQQLASCLGLVCAEDVHAEVALPRFDNSSMDGYAVLHADVAAADADHPVELPVVGEIGAGRASLVALASGTAAKIMTGAPVPAGCDAVVPYEWTDRGVARVRISQAPQLQQHIRPAGGDVRAGDLVVAAGTRLGPRHLGLLAAVGRSHVLARPRPRVVVMSTGSELREPGQPLAHDSIYDSNSFQLAGCATAAGAVAYRVGIVPDEPAAFLKELDDQLVRADLVITSGGVSMGDYDVVKEALTPLGVWFGPVAMQPGKPQGFGLVEGTPIFTLPGNPVSSYLSFQLFVLPALRRLMGITPEVSPTLRATVAEAMGSPAGKRQYMRGILDGSTVSPAGGAASHLLGDLARANCLFVVPEDVTHLERGDEVEVIPLDD